MGEANDYFKMQGWAVTYRGDNPPGTPQWKSKELNLTQGVLLVGVQHSGSGSFTFELERTDEAGMSAADSPGSQLAAGAEAVRNVTGSLFGGFRARRGVERARELASRGFDRARELYIGAKGWSRSNEGEFDAVDVLRLHSNASLRPGAYQLKVKSVSPWRCHLLVPDLGQFTSDFPATVSHQDGQLSTMKSGPRPLTVSGHHIGRSKFKTRFISLDGTFDETLISEEGQFDLEQYPLKLETGKEYLVEITSDGDYELTFEEGY